MTDWWAQGGSSGRKGETVPNGLDSRQLAAMIVLLLATCAVQADGAASPTGSKKQPPDWARDYTEQDPLTRISRPTLQDLERALQDRTTQDTVIERHFDRAGLSRREQRAILKAALTHRAPQVRQQAAVKLQQTGLLGDVLGEILLESPAEWEPAYGRAIVIALQNLPPPKDGFPKAYRRLLLESLADEDPEVRTAAARQLATEGAAAVPMLLELLQSNSELQRRGAAETLARITKQVRRPAAAPAPPAAPAAAPAMPKSTASRRSTTHLFREFDAEPAASVRVYFGTNRVVSSGIPDPRKRLLLLPLLFCACLTAIYVRTRSAAKERRRGAVTAFIIVACCGLGGWSAYQFNQALRQFYSPHIGADFGPRRDPHGRVHYGWCEVAIPATHKIGKVEQPWIGPEDEREHVVLQRTELLERRAFVDQVKMILAEWPDSARDCFVFVHGYNVTFAQAARRTAQIHHDLDFQGVPLFFSWPSRGSLRHYFSDRTEMHYSVQHIKAFLTTVAADFGAQRVHVIAHSMGADGVSRAIAAMDPSMRKFNEIILAAADIDADVFRSQLAPQIASRVNRSTLYCSRNDLALKTSKTFNDVPRIGDSSREIVPLEGFDTVDASAIDTDLLGHSYYGDCLPILRDVRLLLQQDLPPPERGLQPNPAAMGLTYWTFPLPE